MTKGSKFNMAHRNIKGMKGYSKQGGGKKNGLIVYGQGLGSIGDKWKSIFKKHFGDIGDKWKNLKNGNMMMSWSYNSHNNKPNKLIKNEVKNNTPREGNAAMKSGAHQISSDPKYEWYYTYQEYDLPHHQTNSRSTKQCPIGFEQLGGKCYIFLDEKRSYQDGKIDCQHKNAILAEPKTREEADLIAHKFGSDPEFWIGVYSQDGQR